MQPVHKKTKHRTRTRRSHHAMTPVHLMACPQCGQAKLQHAGCNNCGYVNTHTKLKLEASES
jgi:large subunit ribosomal protein L32